MHRALSKDFLVAGSVDVASVSDDHCHADGDDHVIPEASDDTHGGALKDQGSGQRVVSQSLKSGPSGIDISNASDASRALRLCQSAGTGREFVYLDHYRSISGKGSWSSCDWDWPLLGVPTLDPNCCFLQPRHVERLAVLDCLEGTPDAIMGASAGRFACAMFGLEMVLGSLRSREGTVALGQGSGVLLDGVREVCVDLAQYGRLTPIETPCVDLMRVTPELVPFARL